VIARVYRLIEPPGPEETFVLKLWLVRLTGVRREKVVVHSRSEPARETGSLHPVAIRAAGQRDC
jgi:hypothetical protein